MLDQFRVPEDIAVYVDPDVMRSTVEDIFVALGMPEKHAEQSAGVRDTTAPAPRNRSAIPKTHEWNHIVGLDSFFLPKYCFTDPWWCRT